MARYMVMYETEHNSDGFEVNNLEDGLDHVKDILQGWIDAERAGWRVVDGKLSPTSEQIEDWDRMINNCEAYVFDTEAFDDEADGDPAAIGDGWYFYDGHYYLALDQAESMGWMEYDRLIDRLNNTVYGMTYNELIQTKGYDEMDGDELRFCTKTEFNKYLPVITKLRDNDVSDVVISAYLIDAYHEYAIADDASLADEFGISDDDFCEGHDYWWYEMMGKNPLLVGEE